MRVLRYRKSEKPSAKNSRRHQINAERVKTRITKGDTVRVMRGEDKGKEGEVLRVDLKKARVLVRGVNIVKKHRKARRPEEQSGILEVEAPVALSNVMLLDPKTGAPTRIKARVNADGTKDRVSAKSVREGDLASGEAIPRSR
jgi:large subunit ribosomal protein L24